METNWIFNTLFISIISPKIWHPQ